MKNELKERYGSDAIDQYDQDAIAARVIREIHSNTWDEDAGHSHERRPDLRIPGAERSLHTDVYRFRYSEAFDPAGYISDPDDIRNLTAFFFWGLGFGATDRGRLQLYA